MKLRNLLSEADTELRYGAFDTLRTADPTDPFLGRVAVYDEPEEEEDDFALQIEKAPFRRKAGRPEDPFALYIVDSTGPPMVHISRNIRQEIVIFGRDVKLLPPVVLGGGGSILLNAAETDLLVQISRVDSRTIDGRESRLTTPLELATVIRQIAQLGATYPEIVDILTAAYRQKNLPGPLIVDAIPIRSQAYDEAQLLGAAKKDDGVKKASAEEEPKKFRLFGRLRDRMKR
jgi:hypothetical protein